VYENPGGLRLPLLPTPMDKLRMTVTVYKCLHVCIDCFFISPLTISVVDFDFDDSTKKKVEH